MPSDQPFTTIAPEDSSLAAHLQALDLLSARISSLSARTRWPARVPLNSKASMLGQVIHTNELKVDIGGGYWVEMTANEAQEYVQRRKTGMSSMSGSDCNHVYE
jgi:CTD nuclear envelope phosphatase 1